MDMLAPLNSLAGQISPFGEKTGKELSISNDEMPDNDAIKMFVGQVPRSMDEEELREFFQEFGPVYQLNILKDKNNGVSRGCCFVTYFKRKHALDAQNALHNLKTLPGMHHPIQMKPADTENRNERKLFIGMVSKKLDEEEIKKMFEPFGIVEECSILRDDSGISRGCAFVTFTNRQVAIVAIKAMHHSMTMEGCSSPMVVKFADTQKEKENKKVHQIQTNLLNLANVNTNILSPQYVTFGQGMASINQAAAGSSYAGLLGSPLTIGYHPATQLPNVQAVLPDQAGVQTAMQGGFQGVHPASLMSLQQLVQSQQQQLLGLGGFSQYPPIQAVQDREANQLPHQNLVNMDLTRYAGVLPYLQTGLLQGSLQQQAQPGYLPTPPKQHQMPPPSIWSSLQHQSPEDYISGSSTLLPSPTEQLQNLLGSQGQENSSSQQIENILRGGKIKSPEGGYKSNPGPDGANLFIYHLPQEFGDSDLHETFQPFGTIVSAKVFVDKHTNLSKCFGFVSFTSNESAHTAIQAMNGFQIGAKRLKVQLKRPKDASKPY